MNWGGLRKNNLTAAINIAIGGPPTKISRSYIIAARVGLDRFYEYSSLALDYVVLQKNLVSCSNHMEAF